MEKGWLVKLFFFVHQNEEQESPALAAYFIERLNKKIGTAAASSPKLWRRAASLNRALAYRAPCSGLVANRLPEHVRWSALPDYSKYSRVDHTLGRMLAGPTPLSMAHRAHHPVQYLLSTVIKLPSQKSSKTLKNYL